MARLSLSLLGPFQVTLDGQPVTNFKSNKVRALLAYLAVEADRPHRREVLAGLLWPEWPDRDALRNLRYTLSDLRRVIGDRTAQPSFLLISRDTLQFNTNSDHWLDVAALEILTDLEDLASLEKALALYRGCFLEGFSVSDSAPFEEWTLFTRERLARQMSSALHHLAAAHEQRGEYGEAQAFARRQIELEPWDEGAHQKLMRALSLNGQRGAALAQYETCSRLLAEELGVEPAAETVELYEQIRDGTLSVRVPTPAPPTVPSAELPPFLEDALPLVERPLFVARQDELAQLNRFLDLARSGKGRVAFVTGEAGSGKTTLLEEFTRRAQEVHADLVVASGDCNAYTGIGDPYLPFRTVLGLLTGDVKARWAAGAITSDHARRLWRTLPLSAQALLEAGPDLVDTFIPRTALLERALAYSAGHDTPAWLNRLDEFVGRRPITVSSAPGPQQSDLFKQYTSVLTGLAQHAPLLLVLDDLQWADLGSTSLLFHLGRHLGGHRILIVGAYRPEEVALGRDGARHPLEPVVNEFQRDYGNITVTLGQAENRDFVEAFLDSEPNRLGIAFREMLHRQTRGHPLFTIELLRGLQERGDLVRDAEGRWIEGTTLDWKTLPARVEAAIRERVSRLAEPLQDALRVACVEGEVFTAEVITRVLGTDERIMVQRLSNELDRRHRLVRAQAIERLETGRVSRYRFRNYLFQRYLYDSLDRVERAYLHEDVGYVLEQLYGTAASESAVQLAWHFQEAGITDKAIHYLHQAGDRAVQLSAYQEGRAHLTQAQSLLMTLPDSPQRAQQELRLQLSHGMAWIGDIPGPEWRHAFLRAREICQQIGQTSELCRVMDELSVLHYVQAEHQTARDLAAEALSLAQQAGDPLLVAVSHWCLGFILFSLGEYLAAKDHLDQVISFYKPEKHHHLFVSLRGSDPGASAFAYQACCLWCLGYPEQALKRSQEALDLARDLNHAFSLADALCFGGCLFNRLRGEVTALADQAWEFMRLCREMGFSSFGGTGTCFWGEALVRQGKVQEGIEQIRKGLVVRQSIGAQCHLSGILGDLAWAQAKAGQPEEGLATLAEALAVVEQTNERHWEAELFRLEGELLIVQGNMAEAEASFQRAIEVARRQQAKSWQLRATLSLSRLWQGQGKQDEARELLAEIYGWFSEGFDTPDLQQARALLEELS